MAVSLDFIRKGISKQLIVMCLCEVKRVSLEMFLQLLI